MKLLGAGFLWISLIFLGVTYADKLKKRIFILERTIQLIKHIEVETEYLNLSAQEILMKLWEASEFKELDFVGNVCVSINKGDDFPVAWRNAIYNTYLNYKTDEINKLLQLGDKLGTSDVKNQISMIKLYESYFTEFISLAKNKHAKQAKMSISFGVLMGCMVFILVI